MNKENDMTYLTNRELAMLLCNGGKAEFLSGSGKWVSETMPVVCLSPDLIDKPSPYRAAVETFQITMRGQAFDVPEPVREPLEVGQEYWVPDPSADCWYYKDTWDDMGADTNRLERGLIHLTAAAAVTHGKALCGVA